MRKGLRGSHLVVHEHQRQIPLMIWGCIIKCMVTRIIDSGRFFFHFVFYLFHYLVNSPPVSLKNISVNRDHCRNVTNPASNI